MIVLVMDKLVSPTIQIFIRINLNKAKEMREKIQILVKEEKMLGKKLLNIILIIAKMDSKIFLL